MIEGTREKFNGDLKFGKEGEEFIKTMLGSVEVKTDRKAWKTGNIAVEYSYKGNPSGIAISNARFWIFLLDGKYDKKRFIGVEREDLKALARKHYLKGRAVDGGDDGCATMVLIPIEEIFKLHKEIMP